MKSSKEFVPSSSLLDAIADAQSELKINLRYVSELVNTRCAGDMLNLGLFPNIKEVTESFGAYNAVRNRMADQFPLDDPNIACVAVGDGATPRTAATFAFRTAWYCYSVDPNLRKPRWKNNTHGISRLKCCGSKIEDIEIFGHSKVVVVAVHSHAKLPESIAAIHADVIGVVAMPCCVPLKLPAPPDIIYRDHGILSPKNKIKIWFNVGRKA